MKKIFTILFLSVLFPLLSFSQVPYKVTHNEGWDSYPPEALRQGYYFQKSVLAQMDSDPQMERVILFGKDKGHYPEFDLFRQYVAIVDNYTGKIEFMGEVVTSDSFNMELDDRNCDGISEVYYEHIIDDTFSVDSRGYNMQCNRCYDRIELEGGKTK